MRMAELTLTRIDNRLIHGQVIVKWSRIANSNRILIVDDTLSNDPFMVDIYQMAAPSGMKVELMSTEEAGKSYQKDKLGEGKIMLLFKTVSSAFAAYQKGLHFPTLQLGGIPNEQGKKKIVTAVSVDSTELKQICELHNEGVEVSAQIIPEESKISFDEILKRVGE